MVGESAIDFRGISITSGRKQNKYSAMRRIKIMRLHYR